MSPVSKADASEENVVSPLPIATCEVLEQPCKAQERGGHLSIAFHVKIFKFSAAFLLQDWRSALRWGKAEKYKVYAF